MHKLFKSLIFLWITCLFPVNILFASSNTGQLPATATGEDYNQFSNPTYVYLCDDIRSTETSLNQKQDFYNFNLDVSEDSVITGIEIIFRAFYSTGSSDTFGVELSKDGGVNYTTSNKNFLVNSSSNTTYTLGSSSDLWGTTWKYDNFTNLNFRVRINLNTANDTPGIDCLKVKIYFESECDEISGCNLDSIDSNFLFMQSIIGATSTNYYFNSTTLDFLNSQNQLLILLLGIIIFILIVILVLNFWD